jgi:hypothetical protein
MNMKKILFLLMILTVAACAVKSDLTRAPEFPRNYPTN